MSDICLDVGFRVHLGIYLMLAMLWTTLDTYHILLLEKPNYHYPQPPNSALSRLWI